MAAQAYVISRILWRAWGCVQIKYEEGKNASGHRVYLYHMHRRPGQPELISKTVFFGGTSAPRGHTIEKRSKAVSETALSLAHSQRLLFALMLACTGRTSAVTPFKPPLACSVLYCSGHAMLLPCCCHCQMQTAGLPVCAGECGVQGHQRQQRGHPGALPPSAYDVAHHPDQSFYLILLMSSAAC